MLNISRISETGKRQRNNLQNGRWNQLFIWGGAWVGIEEKEFSI